METIRSQCTKIIGLALIWVFATGVTHASMSQASPEWSEEPSLTKLLSKLGIDPATAGLADGQDATWAVNGKATVTLAFEFTANASQNSFGIYDSSDPTQRIELFSGDDKARASARVWFIAGDDGYRVRVRGGTGAAYEIFYGTQFGFYLSNSSGQAYYSDTRLNGDGLDHLQAYLFQGAGAPRPGKENDHRSGAGYLLAWEDSFGNSNADFQDMIVRVHSVAPVPLPAAFGMALAGLAVFGMAAWRRHATSLK